MTYHEAVTSRFSSRTAWDLQESSYAAAIREARASGRKLYDLTVSNPTHCGFTYPEDLLVPLGKPQALRYEPDPRGLLSARYAVAAYYADHNAEVSPEQILLTTSTSESYSFLFRLLCDPGDEVLVAQPSYPLFDFLAMLDDVRLRPYPLFYDHGWWIDFAELERAITPRTRAILVVHPNNPTGHWTSLAEREQLEQLCARHSLALVVDEVFLDYPLSEARPHTFASGEHPALTFVLSGLSKVAALPQIKAGWLVTLGPASEREASLQRLEVIADTFLSVSTPTQIALPTLLAGRSPIQQQILARARENLAVLTHFSTDGSGRLKLLETAAGWSAVVSLSSCAGESDCAERVVRESGVLFYPGPFYQLPGHLVVSLIGPAAEMKEGIQLAIV